MERTASNISIPSFFFTINTNNSHRSEAQKYATPLQEQYDTSGDQSA